MTDKQIKEEIKHINKRNQEYIAENNRMTEKQIIIDGKECRYWFRPNPDDYRKCSLRGNNNNCDEIKDCFVKELLGKLALKEQECEKLKKQILSLQTTKIEELKKYKQALDEIKEICKVNAINTCWTALNLCDKCDEKEECCLQSPLAKLDAISNIINKTKE